MGIRGMVKSLAHRRSAVVPEALDERRFESSRPTIRKEKAETLGQSANKSNPAERLMFQEPGMSRRFDSATFH
jgi:hypothetical protein